MYSYNTTKHSAFLKSKYFIAPGIKAGMMDPRWLVDGAAAGDASSDAASSRSPSLGRFDETVSAEIYGLKLI
jgi:hypothetical protein